MLVFAAFTGLADSLTHMLPGSKGGGSFGFIGMWGVTKAFYIGLAIHGVRKWKLMWHPEREANSYSYYSGPALPIFTYIPKMSYWRLRIVVEPCFLLLLSTILPSFYLVERAVGTYLFLAGLCLAMKNYTRWFMEWSFLRDILDAQFMGPKIAEMAQGKLDESKDMGFFHSDTFPKDLDPKIREQVLTRIAHIAKVEEGL
jgi:hypothetical protein